MLDRPLIASATINSMVMNSEFVDRCRIEAKKSGGNTGDVPRAASPPPLIVAELAGTNTRRRAWDAGWGRSAALLGPWRLL